LDKTQPNGLNLLIKRNSALILQKVLMLWMCEEFPRNHKIWDTGFDDFCETLSRLFEWLLKCFEKGDMPYYFNKKVNIIESLSDDVNQQVISKLKEILVDIKIFIPNHFPKELYVANEIFKLTHSVKDVFEELDKKDFSRLIQQPELISDVLKLLIADLDLDNLKDKINKEMKKFVGNVSEEIEDVLDNIENGIRQKNCEKSQCIFKKTVL